MKYRIKGLGCMMPLTCFKSFAICEKNMERVLLQDNSVWLSSQAAMTAAPSISARSCCRSGRFPPSSSLFSPRFLPVLYAGNKMMPPLDPPALWGQFCPSKNFNFAQSLCWHCSVLTPVSVFQPRVEVSSTRRAEMVLLVCSLFGFME